MTKYLQTNAEGYITGIVEEGILCGLFGGSETKEVTNEQADAIGALLEGSHRQGEGLLFRDITKLLENK